MIQSPASVVGRFAPSPSGELHFGSLLAALASCCDTRRQQGVWRLRIDDIDPPREVPGASDGILRALDAYGFEWDGEVIYQSHHLESYHHALDSLRQSGLLFACTCSRRKLAGARIYPGTCRPAPAPSAPVPQKPGGKWSANHQNPSRRDTGHRDASRPEAGSRQPSPQALRIHLQGQIQFTDRIQGVQDVDTAQAVGDIVLRRRDGLVAYALACAVDDADGITHVVRGADLLSTTAAQIAVMQALGRRPPCYAHVPIALNGDAHKLSKQTHAVALTELPPLITILQAWHFLGQAAIDAQSLTEFWSIAPRCWQVSQVPRTLQMFEPGAKHGTVNEAEPRSR